LKKNPENTVKPTDVRKKKNEQKDSKPTANGNEYYGWSHRELGKEKGLTAMPTKA